MVVSMKVPGKKENNMAMAGIITREMKRNMDYGIWVKEKGG